MATVFASVWLVSFVVLVGVLATILLITLAYCQKLHSKIFLDRPDTSANVYIVARG